MATKQHYVTRAYLEGFIDPFSVKPGRDGYVWVVDFRERTVKKRSPKNVAPLTGYYDINDPRYKGPPVEQVYAGVESQAIPLFKKLRDGCVQLTLRDRHSLATYIGLQLTRVPSFHEAAWVAKKNKLDERLKELITDDDGLEKRLARYRSLTKDPANSLTPESVKRAVLEGRIKIVRSVDAREHFTALGLRAGFEIAGVLFSMKWTLVQNETNNKFFASDNPVALLTPDANPPKKWDETVEIAIPFSPVQMLSIHSRPESLPALTLVDPKIPDYIGACILPTVRRFVFCSSCEHKLTRFSTFG